MRVYFKELWRTMLFILAITPCRSGINRYVQHPKLRGVSLFQSPLSTSALARAFWPAGYYRHVLALQLTKCWCQHFREG